MCKRTLLLVENGGKRLVVWKRKRWKREGDDDGKRGWRTRGNPETGWCIRWGRNAWPEARVCEALRTSTRRPTGSAIHTALSLSSAFPSWFAVLLFGNADTFLNKQYSPGKKSSAAASVWKNDRAANYVARLGMPVSIRFVSQWIHAFAGCVNRASFYW